MSRSTDSDPTQKVKDAAGWKGRKEHDVVLPSGAEVRIIIPNLPHLVKAGQIPNDLIESAIGIMQGQVEITPELVIEQAEFFNKLLAVMVLDPQISEDDVPDLPYEDVEMLVEIGTRNRDVDAMGRHLAGLHKSREWRTFRGLDLGSAPMASV